MEIRRQFKTSGSLPGTIRLLFTDDMESTIRRMSPEDEHPELTKACCYRHLEGKPLLVFKFEATIREIIHETVHALFHIFRYAGIPTTMTNDETFAYAMEYVVDRILKIQVQVNDKRIQERVRSESGPYPNQS